MLELYETIVKELYNIKSIAALLFLIDHGRELSFKYNGLEYAITWKNKRLYLDNKNHDNIQNYECTWDLIEKSNIQGEKFISVWEDIELLTLF